MRSKTIGALVLAVTTSMGSVCAGQSPSTPDKPNCKPPIDIERTLYGKWLEEEAALYIRRLEDRPALAANGMLIPPNPVSKQLMSKEYAGCLNEMIIKLSGGKFGVIQLKEGDYVAIGVTW